jgi:WD40 repeat protein
MGRFGGLLRRKPDAIYDSIPPFCPKGSSVHQIFGKSEILSVNGISTEKWDDLFSRISLGKSFASSIQAAGSHVAVLAAPGNIHIYDAADFRESKGSPVQHRERVDRVQMNKTASLLVSYGYRTTKIWNVSSGDCILSVDSVESKTRPLTMLFTKDDSELLVGSDDRRVRSLSLSGTAPEWEIIADLEEFGLEKHFTNSASHMAISPDGSMITVGYRRHPASAWELEGSTHVGHCRRKDDVSMVRELRDLVWHPFQPEVLGLNVEGVVFRWTPYEDRVDELPAEATKLAISNDGELFVTGDAHGRIKLYTTANFSLLYQLSAQDAVFGLAFSPDSKRFYDIRGFHANAWEPNSLVRYAESSGDMDSVSEYSVSHLSERSTSASAAIDPITALAGCPSGRLYCRGTQNGIVDLHSHSEGRIATLYTSRAKFAIEHIAWSHDGRHICFSDFSKQLVVLTVSHGSPDAIPSYEQKASIAMRKLTKGPITQLLFHRMSSHVLVHTSSHIHTISLSSYSVEHTKELDSTVSRWIFHPTDQAMLVGFGAHDITILDWTLAEQRRYSIEWPQELGADKSQLPILFGVNRAIYSQDNNRLLLQVSIAGDSSRNSQLLFLNTPDLSSSDQSGHETRSSPPTICLHRMPPELDHDVSLALGLVWGDRLVYVSKDFAICSKQLQWASESTGSSNTMQPRIPRNARARALARGGTSTDSLNSRVKELFAFPGDWANEQALGLCSLWGVETSLLYPRNGEAAVIRCKALSRG